MLVPAAPAGACGSSSSGFSHSAKSSGSQVTICAQIKSVQPARVAVVKPKPAVSVSKTTAAPSKSAPTKTPITAPVKPPTAVKKIAVEPSVFRRPQIVPKPKPKPNILRLVVAKPLVPIKLTPPKKTLRVEAAPTKPKPKSKISSAPKPSIQSTKTTIGITKSPAQISRKPAAISIVGGEISFGPEPISIMVSPSSRVPLGAELALASSSKPHTRTGTLLSKSALVEFSPVRATWSIEGETMGGFELGFMADTEGLINLSVIVSYQVRYQIADNGIWLSAGLVENGAQKSIQVYREGEANEPAEEVAEAMPKRVLLVGETCARKPNSFGC